MPKPLGPDAGRRRLPSLIALTVAATLAVAPQAYAADPDPGGPPAERSRVSSDRSDTGDLALGPAAAADAAIVTDRTREAVAPGVVHTSFDRLDARGWLRGDVLVADLTDPGIEVEYLSPETVSGRAVLSEQVRREGAVAGVNGDFFDINDTGAPLGVGLDDDEGLVHGPASGWNQAAVFGEDGLGGLAEVFLEGLATLPDGAEVALSNLNSPSVAADGVGLYTRAWGPAPRERVVDGVPDVREVVLHDGVVTTVATTPAAGELSGGDVALIGRGAGAAALAGLAVGDRVEVGYGPRSDAGKLATAITGNRVLLTDGEPADVPDDVLAPRTAVGFSDDGSRMVLLTVDGRQTDSRGLTELETAELMRELGADDALNLDGGGSSTMLARDAGATGADVVNSPSDGGERLTPNGLGLLAAPGSGRLTGFRVDPVVEQPDSLRVLTGLTRRVSAAGHDETLAPVAADPRWSTHGRAARVRDAGEGTALVTGRRAGETRVVASRGRAGGALTLDVLGRPVRLTTDTPQVSLADAAATGSFSVLGHDRDGFATWVEPRDIVLDYDESVIDVVPDGSGFRVVPLTGDGATLLTARVGGLSTSIAVTVGLTEEVVDDLDDQSRWQASAFPAQVRATASDAVGRDGTAGGAVALDYALTGTTATRAAYLAATPNLPLPGAPQRIGAWVEGDGKGAWLRANLYDAAGGAAKTITLAETVDWTGWRYVEAEIPPGLTTPYTFFRLYVVETVGTRQYDGRIAVDDLTVSVAREVDVPPATTVVDPMVVTDGTVQERGRWRFAVLSDVQFTADAPDGPLVQQARRTIREVVAAEPDFLVINGDFVDRAFADDIALARRVIDEELDGRLPWYYVPGNHEASGPGDLSVWQAEFGSPWQTFDHRGTRFVLLDSSLGSLRAGGFEQILGLRRALDAAARDRQVRSVVVLAHHPVDDPAPTDTSQLADRKEAALLVDWLAELRAETGKGTAYVASHAGVFAASRRDGVLLPLTGNAGKGPSAAPGQGGFTGWAMVGIDRSGRSGDDWLRVELRPHVDDLELVAPDVRVRRTAPAGATVVQDGRRVPVGYPVSADWHGSGVYVGDVRAAPRRAVAAFDPVTGELTGLRAGRGRLSVTVNEVTASRWVAVRR